MQRIAESINEIFEKIPGTKTRLLLETTSGQGYGIGGSFEQIREVIEMTDPKEKTGVCLDTCHIFAAGYDIRARKAYLETMGAFDKIIGIERLFLIHLNDSKKRLGSHADRHEHIGKGEIGEEAFRLIMKDKRLSGIPKIIETPKTGGGKDWDGINLKKLRLMVSQKR
jgi:deoxyribonuclease-4